ncbi:MAG: flagellar basal-body rod protein FlgF [Proteobacteria bacterium]|nr:flagellar basal-body rod protein FlgF [Pseudomonadota bacterium]
MENSTLIATARQSGLSRQLDIVANNIANMNTNGFKGEKMMFIEHLVKSKGGNNLLSKPLSFVRDIATMTNFEEGAIEKTGNSLDVAIAGEGFFVVQTDEGERYTRNGRFKLDEAGQMVTQSGNPVLSSGGQPFFLSPEDTEISISKDGTVSTNNGDLGRIRLVTFDNLQLLKRSAKGLYASEAPAKDVTTVALAQGMLEGSNVQPIFEMAKMISIQRTYDGVRTFLDREDERMRKMVSEMGQTA